MASYAKLSRSIWTDSDFLILSAAAQRLFILLISQPDLSSVGVLPFTPGRWSKMANDTPAETIRACVEELSAGRFVHVDNSTEELLIRTHIVHDAAWTNPNGKASLRAGHAKIHSAHLAGIVADLLVSVGVTVGEAPAKAPRQAPSEAPSQAPSQGATEAPCSPQQPLANSHKPITSSQQPTDAQSPLRFLTAEQQATAAAALEQWIKHKISAPGVNRPSALERTLRKDAPGEWHSRIAEYIVGNPDADVNQIVFDVMRLLPSGTRRAV